LDYAAIAGELSLLPTRSGGTRINPPLCKQRGIADFPAQPNAASCGELNPERLKQPASPHPPSKPRLSGNCSLAQLPFLLSYELLRESQAFTRMQTKKKGNKDWHIAFSHWDMPLVKSPHCFRELFDYIPTPWLDIPESKRKRFENVAFAYPIRGEDLLDMIVKTCFELEPGGEYQFPPRRPGLDKGCADGAMYSRVPQLRYGVEYILMELDPMKSRNDLILEFKRGIERYYTEKKITRADSIRDKLVKLVSRRLQKAIGSYDKIQKCLFDNKLWPFTFSENTFYLNAKKGEDLIKSYDQAVKRSLKTFMLSF
jgi:hypothetical protein